jgi:hypothetical protein
VSEPTAVARGPARWQVVALVVALCFLAGVVGWLIGRSDDGDESFSAVDVGFLADMSTHHNGAISMSLDYLNRGGDSIVDHFERDILLAQTQEIAVMNALLDDSGDTRASSDDIAMDWMGMTVPEGRCPGCRPPPSRRHSPRPPVTRPTTCSRL